MNKTNKINNLMSECPKCGYQNTGGDLRCPECNTLLIYTDNQILNEDVQYKDLKKVDNLNAQNESNSFASVFMISMLLFMAFIGLIEAIFEHGIIFNILLPVGFFVFMAFPIFITFKSKYNQKRTIARKVCKYCDSVNSVNSKFCYHCHRPLSSEIEKIETDDLLTQMTTIRPKSIDDEHVKGLGELIGDEINNKIKDYLDKK